MLVLAVMLHAGSIWALYVVALCTGLAQPIYDTSAQSILPQVVRRNQLSRANGRLYASGLTANEFVGPPLAGFLGVAGAAIAFAAPVALWVVAAAPLLVQNSRRFKLIGALCGRATGRGGRRSRPCGG